VVFSMVVVFNVVMVLCMLVVLPFMKSFLMSGKISSLSVVSHAYGALEGFFFRVFSHVVF